jgi:hypothetical protein
VKGFINDGWDEELDSMSGEDDWGDLIEHSAWPSAGVRKLWWVFIEVDQQGRRPYQRPVQPHFGIFYMNDTLAVRLAWDAKYQWEAHKCFWTYG